MPKDNSPVGREEFDTLVEDLLTETLSRGWVEYAIREAVRAAVNDAILDLVNTGPLKQEILDSLGSGDA